MLGYARELLSDEGSCFCPFGCLCVGKCVSNGWNVEVKKLGRFVKTSVWKRQECTTWNMSWQFCGDHLFELFFRISYTQTQERMSTQILAKKYSARKRPQEILPNSTVSSEFLGLGNIISGKIELSREEKLLIQPDREKNSKKPPTCCELVALASQKNQPTL